MSFILAVGRPFTPRVSIPGDPAIAANSNGNFRVSSAFNFAGGDIKSASLMTSLGIPAGNTSIDITFKYSINFRADSWCIPGPGYASAYIMLWFMVIPTVGGSAGRVERFTESRKVIAHSISPVSFLLPLRGQRSESERIHFELARPTVAGEQWFFSMIAWTEAAGAGFVAGSIADISGTLHLITAEGR
jgi:hypothetical protein